MSAPRHLWSGDWRRESSARAEELAAGRPPSERPAEAESVAPPRRARVRRPHWRLGAGRLGGRRRLRVALIVASLALVSAGAAYAVISTLVGGAGKPAAAANGSRPWLGIDVSSSPFGGVMVVDVVPGSPADAAGVEPGEVITQIDNRPVATPSDVASAIAGERPGDQVDIELQQGPATYTVRVALSTRPAGYP